jgi:hypothetical protein
MTPQEQLESFKRQLQTAADSKARMREEKMRNAAFQQIGQYLSAALSPFKEAVKQMIGATNEMKRIAASVDRITDITIPEPQINVDLSSFPAPNVTVKPIIDIPEIKFPKDIEMRGFTMLMGYDRGLLENPLPVQLRDAKGKPVNLFENLTTLVQGGGGGFQTVRVSNLSDISISSTASTSVSLVNADGTYYNSDNPLPITGSITTTPGATYYASDAIASVNLIQVGGNTVAQGEGEGAMALRVIHASDALASVNLNQIGGNTVTQGEGEGAMALRIIHASDAVASVNLNQTAGNPTVVGTGYQDNAIRVVHATDAIVSVNLVSSITQNVAVTSATATVAIVGDFTPDSANVNSPPVRIGGVSTQTNPTAIADGNIVNFRSDDLGRQIVRPVQVRDLIATAYASLTTGTETTLLSGIASTFLDLIYVMGTNNSDAAVTVDLRSATGTNIVTSIRIPANGTAGVSLSVPIPQNVAADTWTADMPDITGTTVTLSALFSKEV